jgi:ketosteroid isomerase-like protein
MEQVGHDPRNGKLFMSTQENVQIVTDFFAAVGRGDKQGLPLLSAEHIKWIEDSGFRDGLEEYYPTRTEAGILRETAKPIGAFVWPRPVVVVFGLVAAAPAQGS